MEVRITAPTAIYLSMVLEIERRRKDLGLSMDEMSDLAGVADRYYSKMLWVNRPNGRQAQWSTIDDIVSALYPDGYDLILKAKRGPKLDEALMRGRLRHSSAHIDRKTMRELMSELSAIGNKKRWKGVPASRRTQAAKKAANARAKSLSPARLKQIARRAAKIRWAIEHPAP